MTEQETIERLKDLLRRCLTPVAFHMEVADVDIDESLYDDIEEALEDAE